MLQVCFSKNFCPRKFSLSPDPVNLDLKLQLTNFSNNYNSPQAHQGSSYNVQNLSIFTRADGLNKKQANEIFKIKASRLDFQIIF